MQNQSRNNFDQRQLDYNLWYQTAHRLKHSSVILFSQLVAMSKNWESNLHDFEYHQKFSAVIESYMMITGFALENLMKAVSIFKLALDKGEINSFQKLKRNIWGVEKGHEVLEMARNCGFEFNDEEKDLVHRCTVYLVWAGRYPFATNMIEQIRAEEGKSKTLKARDEFVIQNIFEKAKAVIGDVKY